MADLNERGQIILISAFILAVTFVALALVVNSAIFTENLASRGEVSGSSEALVYQHQVEQSVGEAMAFANMYNTTDPDGSVNESISDIGTRGGIQQAREGQLVNISYSDHKEGTRIADNNTGGTTFLNASSPVSTPDWEVASSVDRTRNVQIKVTDIASLSSSAGSAFTLEANESSSPNDAWRLRIWHDSPEVVVDVETNGGARREECRVPDSTPINLDVTRGLVNGQRCHALTRTGSNGDPMWWGTDLPSGSYDIWIKNGDKIKGNFSMLITPRSAENTDNLQSGPAPGEPFHTDAIYQTTIHYVYVTPNVAYETDVQVAPGEPPS